MTDDQQRARDLLAAEWEVRGMWIEAGFVRGPMHEDDPVLCAITAALRAAPEVPKHAEFYLGQDCFVICDWEDYELVRGYLWKATTLQNGGTRYAQAWQYSREDARKRVSMHRLILNADSDSVIDHINGNGLDNRRSNLRIATRQQNSFNQRGTSTKSPYKGTFFEKSSGLWRASICVNGKKISGGRHQSIIDAAKAYDALAVKHHGEFARLNFAARPQGVK